MGPNGRRRSGKGRKKEVEKLHDLSQHVLDFRILSILYSKDLSPNNSRDIVSKCHGVLAESIIISITRRTKNPSRLPIYTELVFLLPILRDPFFALLLRPRRKHSTVFHIVHERHSMTAGSLYHIDRHQHVLPRPCRGWQLSRKLRPT